MCLTKNYPKASGDLFITFIEECHPGAYLLHVKNTTGNTQDIAYEVAGTTHVSRQFNIGFLYWSMKSEDKENMIEENFLICISSTHVVTLCRIMSVFYLAICVPMR